MANLIPTNSAIDEGGFIQIGGQDQWVTIRGRDRRNPLLLILSGPGFAMSPLARFFEPWEAAFTLVQWDQPGAGATQAKNADATPTLTYAGLTRDGLQVAAFALGRTGADRVVLLATSGGTVIGLKMIRARPQLFSAYVGAGQIVNRAVQEALSYAMVLERARAAGEHEAIQELEGIGPPPYADIAAEIVKSKYANAPTPAEARSMGELAALGEPPADAAYVARGLPAVDPRAAGLAAYLALKDELAAFDARRLGLAFETPMFFLQGAQDAHTVTSEVVAYAQDLVAPKVVVEIVKEGGHMALFLRERMLTLLEAHVRPAVL
jgi:pimeloyl-ACP methyl ester carboxylesterase